MNLFRTFSFKVVLRLILVFANMWALAAIFGDERLLFNQIILGIILVIQVYELIRFVNRTNKELSKFLLAIKYSDLSANFSGHKMGESFNELDQAFAEIIESFKNVKIEKEAQFQYLSLVVDKMNVGIISVEDAMNITLMNKAAEKILGISGIKNWKILEEKQRKFAQKIDEIGKNGSRLIEIRLKDKVTILSIDVTSSTYLEKSYKLVTFKDIQDEVEQTEIEAWHKLIRILTHEIMNSITPISSLTETMQGMLDKSGGKVDDDMLEDLQFSLKTIQRRSNGMLAFVDDYRKLTKVPNPILMPVVVSDLFESVRRLMDKKLSDENVNLSIKVQTGLTILLDEALLEQVLINLITNSVHALNERSEDKRIELDAYVSNGRGVLVVRDNGAGIEPKELKEIFVPFFTTKTEGSGIGLSLSKQIMHLHGGSIKVESEVNEGTSFYLSFGMI